MLRPVKAPLWTRSRPSLVNVLLSLTRPPVTTNLPPPFSFVADVDGSGRVDGSEVGEPAVDGPGRVQRARGADGGEAADRSAVGETPPLTVAALVIVLGC